MISYSNHKKVKEFHETYGAYISEESKLPDSSVRELRIALLQEEFDEYTKAEEDNDLVEIADALGDMMYIIYGTAISYGIPLDDIFNEIHSSNMSKLGEDGKPIRREDGKILKGPNFFRPDIAKFLKK